MFEFGSRKMFEKNTRQLQLTARAYHRVLKLSCTIADLAESEEIAHVQLVEALQYRPKIDLF